MIKEIRKEEFDGLAVTFPNVTFYETTSWAALKEYTGWKALYLGYYEEEHLEGIGLFLLKKMPVINAYLAYSPRGYLINFYDPEILERFNKELIPFLKVKKVFQLIIDPYLPLNQRDINGSIIESSFDNRPIVDKLIGLGYRHTGYNLAYENLQPRWLFRLPLKDRTYEELEKSFRKEAKRRANKKDYFAINVRELREEEVPVFKDLMDRTSKRRGFIDRSLGYYKQMYDALHESGILRYMVAEIDIDRCRDNVNREIEKLEERIARLSLHKENNEGRIKEENVTLNANRNILKQLDICEKQHGKVVPLSVVCLLSYGREMIMLLAGNDEEYLQHFNTSNIIVAELIKLALKEGYDYYNFYGITGNFDPENENYGLYTYKKQYGGEVLELIGQFEYTIRPLIKRLYDVMLKAYKLTKK
ncbi:MAG: peptidoglycan bridge formation glycyltransferase FemA/FemB family protein [Erysipelotrichaceae bacterium]|nr:peptidoglycan bridge formation glycyltransferase FemA/FemB family protein [Erysipelotrichaceae bacterium]